MAFLVWGFGSSLAAQTLVSDSLLQARTHWVWTGGALWGSQPTWGVNWHGFSMALWGHCLHCREMEWALGAQTEGSPVWRETQAWLGLGKTWGDRIRGREDWDVRFQGQPHKRSVWRWSMWGTHETFMGGIHLRHEALKASWWMGRDRSGEQAFARHVEGAWGEGGLRQWGVFALDGQGDWRGAYVMVRALDGRVWSRTPNMGWRMGVWVTQQRAREASWTAQCSWSPSQQETFRCAWRWRWEP